MVRVTRRFLLGALLGGAASRAMAGAPLTSVRPISRAGDVRKRTISSVDTLLAEAKLTGKTGFVVAEADTGKVLEARNPLLALPPASVTKSITALYALDRLGPGYQFRTRLLARGKITGGRLKGDLILAGGGDPTLDTDGLGDMARQLKETGLREVSGKFLVYAGALPTIRSIDPGQPVHVSYNPTVSGLNLNYNRVHFEWKQQAGGYTLKLDARARKYSPLVAITRIRVVERAVPVYTYADKGGADQWTVARGALGKGGSRWLPVRKPELYAAEVFQTLCRSYGIVLPRAKMTRSLPQSTLLVERKSAQLNAILRNMLKYSTNLTAEIVGLTASTASGAKPRSLQASASRMTAWARNNLGLRESKFVDHSGLGGASKLAAADMVKALVKVRGPGTFPAMLKEIPMRNSKGDVLPDHPIKIHAKTGTLNFVSALAGYLSDPGGRELAFAIFSADLPRRKQIRTSDGDIPKGTRSWKKRARLLQLRLIERWGTNFTG